MSAISIRIPEISIHEADKWAKKLNLPRAEYIRQAVELMNKRMSKYEKCKRLQKASLKVRKDSLRINKEFSEIDHDPEI